MVAESEQCKGRDVIHRFVEMIERGKIQRHQYYRRCEDEKDGKHTKIEGQAHQHKIAHRSEQTLAHGSDFTSSPRVAVSNLLKFLASPSNHQRGAAEQCLLIHPFGLRGGHRGSPRSCPLRGQSRRLCDVSFMDYDLGYFDDETCRLEPLANPFGPKVLPMSSV
jgi:hypothetical protein